MSKLGRFWDWLLPGLICLCPMGALAYYNACAENEAPQNDSTSTGRLHLAPHQLMGAAAIPLARL